MAGETKPAPDYELTAPRTARTIITAVLLGYTLNTAISLWGGGRQGSQLLVLATGLGAVLLLQLAHSTGEAKTWPTPWRITTVSLQSAATFVPLLWVGPEAGATAGFLAASMLLVVGGPVRWLLFSAVVMGILVALIRAGMAWSDVLYGVYFTSLTGLAVYGVSSLAALAGTVHAARGGLVRMAVLGERLRLARDLHDLLGFNISAIMLKSELAYRLLPRAAAQGRREIRDVLGIAHRALADVRAVTQGSSPMSLAAEIGSTEAMLTTAEIDVQVSLAPRPLPVPLDTVLAIVLREAATNILRHSKAEAVRIDLSEHNGRIQLRIANDGIDTGSATGVDGSGLQNLTSRLEAVDGRLTAIADGDWFRLTVEAPLSSASPGPDDLRDERPDTADLRNAQSWHLLVARLVVVVVLSGYGLLVLINILPRQPGTLGLAAMMLCLAFVVGLEIGYALGKPRAWPTGVRAVSLLAQTVVSLLPLLWLDGPWGSMGGFLAGSLLLAISGPWRWAGYAGVGLGVGLLSVAHTDPGVLTAYLVLSTLLTGLVTYGIGSLSIVVAQVDHFRRELARLAVTATRLEAADRLNEFIGRDLSLMTVKTELANRLMPLSPDRARAEMAEVLQIARLTVAKVRSVASGYRHRSFTLELESAVPALVDAGIQVEVEVPADQIPADLDALLALVLRDATMNTLAVREVRRCRITMTVDDEQVRLQIADDRSGPMRSDSEIEDLAERVQAIGGNLQSATDGDWFTVSVEIPRQFRLTPALRPLDPSWRPR